MAFKAIYNASAQKIVVQDGQGTTISEDPTLVGANGDKVLMQITVECSVPAPILLND